MHLGVRRNCIALAACAGVFAALSLVPGPPLRIATSTSLLPLAASARGDLRTAFGQDVPVSAMGSAFAVSAVLRGTADIALTDVAYRISGLTEQPVARLEIAAVGGPGTPRALSLSEVTQLLRGEIRSWRAVGGKDIPVRLVLRTPGSGVRAALSRLTGGRLAPGQIAALSNGQVLRVVRSLPGALGFVEAHYAPGNLRVSVGGRLPGQSGYPLAFRGYAAYVLRNASARLGAAILAARARAEGMGP